MNGRISLAVLTLLICLMAAGKGEESKLIPEEERRERFTVKLDVNLVKVPVTVLDQTGRPVGNLRAADFKLFEEGIEQEIRGLGYDVGPASAVLLLDLSSSVKRELKQIRQAAMRFSRALTGSRFAIITFSDEVEMVQGWTDNLKVLEKGLKRVSTGFRTSLYDAIYLAAEQMLASIDGKKAIILLTDGIDNQSSATYSEAAEALIKCQSSIYIISLTRMVEPEVRNERRIQYLAKALEKLGEKDAVADYFQRKEEELARLCDMTGGRIFLPLKLEDLENAYQQVADELRNKYFLTYVSSNNSPQPSFRKIKVLYTRGPAKVLYRSGYYVKQAAK